MPVTSEGITNNGADVTPRPARSVQGGDCNPGIPVGFQSRSRNLANTGIQKMQLLTEIAHMALLILDESRSSSA